MTMKRKKMIGAIISAVVVIIIVVSVVYQRWKPETQQTVTKETTVEYGNLTVGVTESGSASLGTVDQTFDIDINTSSGTSENTATSTSTTTEDSRGMDMAEGNKMDSAATESTTSASNTSSVALEVEKVYVAEGQVVEKGDSLVKLTSESIKEVRAALKTNLASANLTLKSAKITRKETSVNAKYEYKENITKGENAKATYNATISSLQSAVEEAQDAVSEAKERMEAIPKEIATLNKKKKQVQASATQTASKAGNAMPSDNGSEEKGTSVAGGENNTNTTGTTANSDTSTLSSINSQIASLQNELSNVKKNYSNLVSKVSQAKSELVTGKITAKKTYDEAMLNYKNAKEIYDIAMDGIDDEVDDAKEQVKEAKKTLAAYEKMVKNGVITSDYAGTILSLGYAEGDTLNTSTAIASFADADAVTVTVSVSQEDVSTIAIGDVVNIVFSAYEEETYSGVVSAIDTAETSDNSSMIDYDVTVKVTGDVFKIYQGMTSNVTFITKELKNVVYVSNKAIQTEGTKSYVKKKEGNTIVKKEVVTGFSNGSSVEIQSGLEEGDVVLIESQVSSS